MYYITWQPGFETDRHTVVITFPLCIRGWASQTCYYSNYSVTENGNPGILTYVFRSQISPCWQLKDFFMYIFVNPDSEPHGSFKETENKYRLDAE